MNPITLVALISTVFFGMSFQPDEPPDEETWPKIVTVHIIHEDPNICMGPEEQRYAWVPDDRAPYYGGKYWVTYAVAVEERGNCPYGYGHEVLFVASFSEVFNYYTWTWIRIEEEPTDYHRALVEMMISFNSDEIDTDTVLWMTANQWELSYPGKAPIFSAPTPPIPTPPLGD